MYLPRNWVKTTIYENIGYGTSNQYLDNPSEKAVSISSHIKEQHETAKLLNEVKLKNTYNLNKWTEQTSAWVQNLQYPKKAVFYSLPLTLTKLKYFMS